MRSYIFVLLLAVSQTLGDSTLNELKGELLKQISSPNDTSVQSEALDVVAEYLIASLLEENGLSPDESQEDSLAPSGKKRDKEAERERQREKQIEKLKERIRQKEKHRHRPHIDYRDPPPTNAPVVNNPPVINNAGLNPAVAASDVQTKQDVTQIPVLTGAPAAGTSGATAAPVVANPAATAAPVVNPPVTAAPIETTTQPRRTRPTVDPNHVYQQVDKILGSVASGNIVGIVDESLAIRAPTPVRNFVTGIMKVIFCNPINRILGRCTPNSSGQISSVQGR